MDNMNSKTQVAGQDLTIIPFLKKSNAGLPDESPSSGQSAKFDGPLSREMWNAANKIKSSYPDSFDYGIYDKLYERFGETQPRGGVVFKSSIKLLEAQDCSKCFYRFEIDTYGRGCTHNCKYCYAKSYLSVRKTWNEPMPFPSDIVAIRKMFATVFESDKQHKYRHILEKHIPIRIGSMSDSFMWLDKKYKVTQELLKILKFYRYPYLIFTRSDLVSDEEYMALLDRKLASIQMSISSTNEEMTRLIEPGAPSPKRRLQALQKLAENGFWTTARINPLFLIYPDGYYTDPNFDRSQPLKPFNYFSWDMIESIAQHKIPSLLVGAVRLYRNNLHFMNKALGYDIQDLFAANRKMERASFHFSRAETEYYYREIKRLSDIHGVRYSTCYIGNDPTGESFEKFRPLWTNRNDCCDAKGNVSAFKTTCADIPQRISASPALIERTTNHHFRKNF